MGYDSRDALLKSLDGFIENMKGASLGLASEGIRYAHAVIVVVDEETKEIGDQASCIRQLDEEFVLAPSTSPDSALPKNTNSSCVFFFMAILAALVGVAVYNTFAGENRPDEAQE